MHAYKGLVETKAGKHKKSLHSVPPLIRYKKAPACYSAFPNHLLFMQKKL